MSAVLFVCLGNICRSPTAEAIFATRTRDQHHSCDSAGTSGWHLGEPPYGDMIAAAGARGVAMDHLRARQFGPQDFTDFDLLIAMDDANVAAMEAMRPTGNATAIRKLMDFAPGTGVSEVPDPYYTRDFDEALDLIEAGIDGLINALQPQ